MSAEHKYAAALQVYASTDRTIKSICEELGLPFRALISYISSNRRDLILKRHRLEGLDGVRLRGAKGQSTASLLKYGEAVAAARSHEYIEFNMSQLARIFGVDPTGLANQLRRHYPGVLPARERERRRMGIGGNRHHGVRPVSEEGYAAAVGLLRTTDMTLGEAAEAGGVTSSGLRDHLQFYHQDIVEERERKRKRAAGSKVRGGRSGSWSIHGPGEETVEKYAEAIDLYRTTSLSVKEIVMRLGISPQGFKFYLRTWHPDLMVERRGFAPGTSYARTKRFNPATAAKYAPAIARLRELRASRHPGSLPRHAELVSASPSPRRISIRAVAAEFGLNSEVFRSYLRQHHPDLLK